MVHRGVWLGLSGMSDECVKLRLGEMDGLRGL